MQGFNMGRYYPPSTTSALTFNTSSHPLGARAKKLHQGILTVRFEMPFAIWCTTCSPEALIGQGVRFNAEKRTVGRYHSTPVLQFRMKHAACGGCIAIRTDPAAAEYVVESGARRRDYGDGRAAGDDGAEGGEILTAEERARRREDAFAAFEGKKAQVVREKSDNDRVEELHALREKDWADPYARSRKLRRAFREGRKEREKAEGVREELRERFGLGVEIADEREEDAVRARLVEFGAVEGEGEMGLRKAAAAPLFGSTASGPKDQTALKGLTKSARKAEMSRSLLQAELKGNTRAAMDPFLSEKTPKGSHVIAGLKKKRSGNSDTAASDVKTTKKTEEEEQDEKAELAAQAVAPTPPKPLALVDYDSD